MPKVFGVIEHITLLGYILRTFVVALILFLVGRFITKRAVQQLTVFDFVFTWLLGAITVAPLLDGKISFTYAAVPLLTLFFWHALLSFGSKYSLFISHFFNGNPVIVINQRQIVTKNLKKHFINIELLLAQLRLKNIFNVADIEYAVLEPNGQISVMKKPTSEHITPKDINVLPSQPNISTILIQDGKLDRAKLENAGLNEKILKEILLANSINDYNYVLLATIDQQKNIYVSKKKNDNP